MRPLYKDWLVANLENDHERVCELMTPPVTFVARGKEVHVQVIVGSKVRGKRTYCHDCA